MIAYSEVHEKHNGFTLAEVLITLGIIGVVAAMTLPALIQNYQKGVVLNRLKQTYAQIAVGAEAAAADQDNTPIHQWQCDESWADGAYMQESCFYKVFEKIGAKLYPQAPSQDKIFCYEDKPYREYTQMNGIVGDFAIPGKFVHPYSWSAKMPNGACVVWTAYAHTGDARGRLVIDVDGPYSGPNRLGRDTFLFQYCEANSGRGLGNDGRTVIANGQGGNRNQLKNGCKKADGIWGAGTQCAALIISDNWQIKNDYPW